MKILKSESGEQILHGTLNSENVAERCDSDPSNVEVKSEIVALCGDPRGELLARPVVAAAGGRAVQRGRDRKNRRLGPWW